MSLGTTASTCFSSSTRTTFGSCAATLPARRWRSSGCRSRRRAACRLSAAAVALQAKGRAVRCRSTSRCTGRSASNASSGSRSTPASIAAQRSRSSPASKILKSSVEFSGICSTARSPTRRYPRREHRHWEPPLFSIDHLRSHASTGRCWTGFTTVCRYAAEGLKNDTH